MRKIALTLAALALSATAADAGPIRDRLKARFGRPACASGQCGSAVAFPAAAPTTHAVTYSVGGNCPGGVCYPAAAPVVFPAGR